MATDPSNLAPNAATGELRSDLAGYPDVPRLVDGYRNSSEEAKRQRERADKAEGLLSQVLTTAANPRQSVPDRTARPEDRLTDMGVPVDALKEYVGGLIRSEFEPIARGIAARGRLVADNPSYVQFEQDVAQFIASEPGMEERYNRMFTADPQGAMEYAFLRFGESRRRAAPEPGNGTREGLADAQIPGSRAGEGRRAPDPNDRIQAAYERYRQTGSTRDAAEFARARLNTVISEEFLRQ